MTTSQNAEEAFQKALQHFDRGELPAAAEGFERAIRLDASHQRAHYQLGNVRREQGRFAEAAAHFEAAVALLPGHAEAHNNLGVVQQVTGRPYDAIRSYKRAVELKPALSQAYLNLGRLLAELGRSTEAAEWYRRGAAASGEPQVFAHLLAGLEGRSTAAAPADYVRTTFDAFAPQFDAQLASLDYRVPEAIARAVARVRHFAPSSADVLDLGCGTGLSGLALAPFAGRLAGVDLSPRMLQQARARGCYHELAEADLVAWMRNAPPAQFDLIVAADVLIYLGDLHAVFAEAARLLRPRGLFAFSIEECAGADWRLQESGRYAQSPGYIERLAREQGFVLSLKAQQPIRTPIVGLLYILSRKDLGESP